MPIVHHVDFVELAGYTSDETGGTPAIRFLKDLDAPIEGRDVLIVEDVVDTGLTLHYLVKTFRLRSPRSLAAVTLLDRPYRRLVDDLPVRYVGFTVPDEFFVGYGFDIDEKYRNLPDLHVLRRRPRQKHAAAPDMRGRGTTPPLGEVVMRAKRASTGGGQRGNHGFPVTSSRAGRPARR